MDLSHWDLVGEFTLYQAACLASGVEPGTSVSIEESKKIQVITGVMDKAFCDAVRLVAWLDPWDDYDKEFSAQIDSGDVIVSIDLGKAIEKKKEDGIDFDYEFFRDYSNQENFTRHSIGKWFGAKGFKPLYRFSFDAQAAEEKPRGLVSDNTLVSTIAALMAAWPGGKSPSGKDLEKAASSIGVSVSDDSIRKALKLAQEIAPSLKSA